MATNDLNHNLVLLDILRSILVAVGDAEQIPEESHALFLERFDDMRKSLPVDPINSQYLGQDLMCQVIERYPQIAHLVPRDLLWYFGGAWLLHAPSRYLPPKIRVFIDFLVERLAREPTLDMWWAQDSGHS